MNTPVIIQATARHTATVFFMHGLGDNGHGWAPVFQEIRSPHIKYILPHAPIRPVTLNNGMEMPAWFDSFGLKLGGEEDEVGIKLAAKNVHHWIETEIKQGIPNNRIMLGGFSQGGGLAIYSALTFDKPLAGVIAMSSRMPLHTQLPGDHKANLTVPILQCHGLSDALVPSAIGDTVSQYLKAFNKNHIYKTYPGMAHESCEEEIEEVKQFIENCLAN